MNTIYDEMACAATGTDCNATAAWLQEALRIDRPDAARRAEAHWAKADAALQDAICAKVMEVEREPLSDVIMRDYADLWTLASNLLDFQG